MRLLKRWINGALGTLGYEIRKKQVPASEPDALAFGHFLDAYLMGIDPASFRFIQIGAHDGRFRDPIHERVAAHRLRGVLVEPQAEQFAKLKRNYAENPNLIFENAAIGHHNGDATLYKVDPALCDRYADFSGMASLDRGQVRRALAKHAPRLKLRGDMDVYITRVAVPTLTFDALIEKHGIQGFDLLQVDVEGFDFEIIKMLRLETARHRPRIINYEHAWLSAEDRVRSRCHLAAAGYRLFVHRSDTTAYFGTAGWRQRPTNPGRAREVAASVENGA